MTIVGHVVVAAFVVCLVCVGCERAAPEVGKQYLELRLYTVDAGEKRERLDRFLADVAVPAWNRTGIANVGVFEVSDGARADLYVLLSHDGIASFAGSRRRLLADKVFLRDGGPYLDLPKKDPLYRRVESSLMLGFDECPRVEVPERSPTRIFQLRTYESHSLKKGVKKIEMFNAGGEMALFRECGMKPVFFGETLAGAKMPNLTYMIVFKDDEARKANWKKFLDSPEWDRLKGMPVYKDTVSGITNIFLKPTSYSQL